MPPGWMALCAASCLAVAPFLLACARRARRDYLAALSLDDVGHVEGLLRAMLPGTVIWRQDLQGTGFLRLRYRGRPLVAGCHGAVFDLSEGWPRRTAASRDLSRRLLEEARPSAAPCRRSA